MEQQSPCACTPENVTCTSVAAQYADVSVPIKVRPQASVGALTVECCGAAAIALCATGACGCELTITQTVCIHIPIVYGATADVGEVASACKKNSVCPGMCNYR